MLPLTLLRDVTPRLSLPVSLSLHPSPATPQPATSPHLSPLLLGLGLLDIRTVLSQILNISVLNNVWAQAAGGWRGQEGGRGGGGGGNVPGLAALIGRVPADGWTGRDHRQEIQPASWSKHFPNISTVLTPLMILHTFLQCLQTSILW